MGSLFLQPFFAQKTSVCLGDNENTSEMSRLTTENYPGLSAEVLECVRGAGVCSGIG